MAILTGKAAIDYIRNNPRGTWKPVGSQRDIGLKAAGDPGLLGGLANGLVSPIAGGIDLINTATSSNNPYTSKARMEEIRKNPWMETAKVGAGLASYAVPGGIGIKGLGTVGRMALGGAVGGGLMGFSSSKPGEELQGAGTGALLGGAIGGGLGVAGNVIGKVKGIGKGVSAETKGITGGVSKTSLAGKASKFSEDNAWSSIVQEAGDRMPTGGVPEFKTYQKTLGFNPKTSGLSDLQTVTESTLNKEGPKLGTIIKSAGNKGATVPILDVVEPAIKNMESATTVNSARAARKAIEDVLYKNGLNPSIKIKEYTASEIRNLAKTVPDLPLEKADALRRQLGWDSKFQTQSKYPGISDVYKQMYGSTSASIKGQVKETLGEKALGTYSGINERYSVAKDSQAYLTQVAENQRPAGVKIPTLQDIKTAVVTPKLKRFTSRAIDKTLEKTGKGIKATPTVQKAVNPQVKETVTYLNDILKRAKAPSISKALTLGITGQKSQ